jgi:peptidylprolyl isomerase domain and WD repeat-containing protein 1
MLTLEATPKAICWVHKRGASLPLLAMSDEDSHSIRIYDGRGENQNPLHTISKLHRNPVSLMVYNDVYDCAVSVDDGGMVEYWRPHGDYEKPDNVFQYKSSTGLFEFKKVASLVPPVLLCEGAN